MMVLLAIRSSHPAVPRWAWVAFPLRCHSYDDVRWHDARGYRSRLSFSTLAGEACRVLIVNCADSLHSKCSLRKSQRLLIPDASAAKERPVFLDSEPNGEVIGRTSPSSRSRSIMLIVSSFAARTSSISTAKKTHALQATGTLERWIFHVPPRLQHKENRSANRDDQSGNGPGPRVVQLC